MSIISHGPPKTIDYLYGLVKPVVGNVDTIPDALINILRKLSQSQTAAFLGTYRRRVLIYRKKLGLFGKRVPTSKTQKVLYDTMDKANGNWPFSFVATSDNTIVNVSYRSNGIYDVSYEIYQP